MIPAHDLAWYWNRNVHDPGWIVVDFQYWLSTGIEVFMILAGLSLLFSTGLVLEPRFP